MSTTVEAHLPEIARDDASSPNWTGLLAPLGGLGLVAGLVALFLTPAGEDTGETPAEVAAYAASHEGWITATALFGLFAVLLGGSFVAGLHTRLRGVATANESTLVLIGGVVFTLCFVLCWLIWTAPLVDIPADSTRALSQAEAYLGYDDVAWLLLGASGIGASMMAIPASLAAMRGGLPAWLGWLGVALGLASLATVAFFGLFAWMAWIAIASVAMLVLRRA